MIAFARIAGPILLLAFGGQALAFSLRDWLMADIQTRMQSQGQFTIATLDRAQQRKTFLTGTKRYFYAYSGRYQNRSFETIEEVAPQYYHLNSEGKNVEVLAYRDAAGNLHTHLRGNSHPFAENFDGLRWFSLSLAALGAVLSMSGWLAGSLFSGWRKQA